MYRIDLHQCKPKGTTQDCQPIGNATYGLSRPDTVGSCNNTTSETGWSYSWTVPSTMLGEQTLWSISINESDMQPQCWVGKTVTVVTPTPTIPKPNCKNVSGPTTLVVGNTYTYSATFENGTGTLTDCALAIHDSCSSNVYWSKSGCGPGTVTRNYSWTPTKAGTYTIDCRAWNDGYAECRGDCVTSPPVYACDGPGAKLTVNVVANSPPSTPTLSLPADGSTCQNTSLTLSWNAVSNWGTCYPTQKNQYKVYLDDDTGFGADGKLDGVSTTSTSYSVSGLSANTTYYWKIVADNGCLTASSSTWSFTTKPNLPAAPTILTPVSCTCAPGIDQNCTCSLDWNDITGAKFYPLRIDDQANPWSDTCSWTYEGDICQDNLVSSSYNFTTAKGDHTYEAWVQAIDSCGQWSPSSTKVIFTAPWKVGKPTLVSPANQTVCLDPINATLSWNPVLKATSYKVYLADNPSFNNPQTFSTTQTSYSKNLSNFTTYYWKVEAFNAFSSQCGSTFSDTWSFTTKEFVRPQITCNQDPATGDVVSATVSDPQPGSGVQLIKILYENETDWTQLTLTPPPPQPSYTINLDDHASRVFIQAWDACNNPSDVVACTLWRENWFQVKGGGLYSGADLILDYLPASTYLLNDNGLIPAGLGWLMGNKSIINPQTNLSPKGWYLSINPNAGYFWYPAIAFQGLVERRKTGTSLEAIKPLETSIIKINNDLTLDANAASKINQASAVLIFVQGKVNLSPSLTKLNHLALVATGEIKFENQSGNEGTLTVDGIVVADANKDGQGKIIISRYLDKDNKTSPAVIFQYNPKIVFDLAKLWERDVRIREILP